MEEKKTEPEAKPVGQRPTNPKAAELQEAVRAAEAGNPRPAVKDSPAAGMGPKPPEDPRLGLFRKMLAVQANVEPVEKNAHGYNYRYATLGEVLKAVTPQFERLGLMSWSTTSQTTIDGKEYERLTTYIVDVQTGAEVHAEHTWPYTPDPQKQGSYETYYRRYALVCLLDIPIADDDGAAAHAGHGPVRQPGRNMPRPLNQNQNSNYQRRN